MFSVAVTDASKTTSFPTSIVRYDLALMKRVQTLAPILVGAGAIARRSESYFWMGVVGLATCAAMRFFFVGRRRINAQVVYIDPAKRVVTVGDELLRLAATQTDVWTMPGRVARIYQGETCFALKVDAAVATDFHRRLADIFGQALPMPRRGSKRARWIAGAVLLLSLPLAAFGAFIKLVPLFVIGFAAFFGGVVATGVLFQRAPKR